jgi:hypothetical protein
VRPLVSVLLEALVSVLVEPLAPIALLPLLPVSVLLAVLPVVPAVPPDEPEALGLLSVVVLLEPDAAPGLVVLLLPLVDGLVLGLVLVLGLELVPDAPVLPPDEPVLPDVWASDSPPTASAAAAARAVRVFLVVIMSCSLSGNPEGGG